MWGFSNYWNSILKSDKQGGKNHIEYIYYTSILQMRRRLWWRLDHLFHITHIASSRLSIQV